MVIPFPVLSTSVLVYAASKPHLSCDAESSMIEKHYFSECALSLSNTVKVLFALIETPTGKNFAQYNASP